MELTAETPTYDTVLLDLGIDPADQQGHGVRMEEIIAKHASKLDLEALRTSTPTTKRRKKSSSAQN